MEEASERPYEQAVRHLADRHEIAMGKELLEHLTKTVGEYWLAQDGQRVAVARASHGAAGAIGRQRVPDLCRWREGSYRRLLA